MSVESELNKFGKGVVKEAKTALTKQKINVSKELYNSINYDLKVSKNSFELTFSMANHGKFVNDGVVGTEQNRTKNLRTPLGSEKFKYKKGIENKPSSKHFDKWIVRRGFSPRNKKGQFTSRKGLAIAVSYGVWRKGIKTTEFFTKPLNAAYEKLPEKIIKSYALTVDKLLANTL